MRTDGKSIYQFFEYPILERLHVLKKGAFRNLLKRLELGCCTDIPLALTILAFETWLMEKKY